MFGGKETEEDSRRRFEKKVMEGLWVEFEEGMEEDKVRMYRTQGLTMRGGGGWEED